MQKRFSLHETNNYDSFNWLETNRDVKSSTVKKLIKSIKEKGLQSPIIVNESGEIVDGQHRLVALRELGYAVPYIVSHAWKNEKDTVAMQEAVKWNALDYATSLAAKGNFDCLRALEIAKEYSEITNGEMGTIRTLELLMDTNGWGILSALKRETYKINEEIANDVFEAAQLMAEFDMGTSPFGARIIRPLKRLHYVNGGLDLDVITKMVNDSYIRGFAKENDQLEYFKDLYNKHSK